MATYGDALLRFKRGFLIIGLTGFTGSGCTTSSLILRNKRKPELPLLQDLNQPLSELETISQLDYQKLSNTWNTIPWYRFDMLEVSRIIFMIVIYHTLRRKYSIGLPGEIRRLALASRNDLKGISFLVDKNKDPNNPNIAKQIVIAYDKTKPIYAKFKKDMDLGGFILAMQDFGDNIRKYGTPIPSSSSRIQPRNIFILPETIRRLMKAYITDKNAKNFVIDALRNPFEVEYFKRRYKEFYLVSIERDSHEIKALLSSRLTKNQIDSLWKREKCESIRKKSATNISRWVTSQNIGECKQKADYVIKNRKSPTRIPNSHLIYHLIRLISLIKYPACVPPTMVERNMQIAVIASQNSGCLSRHVGAVVTDNHGYVLGIGWNDPPMGQIPCSLRTAEQLLNNPDSKTFSEYERSDEFCEHIKRQKLGNQPFCFREEFSSLQKKGKQAEYTRAVHAEENALLQAANRDLRTINDSVLYTTDSPCTLCAKKAYQLGISKIIYLEEYPGVSVQQTLYTGEKPIQLYKYEGATGSGYLDLLTILVPEKEMLSLYLRK